ncbi:hypothetical protein FAZ19_07430 [Sphingobacterium alkalisoli]|uniref:WD40 repeat domain-containing protein n=1 Tax=Sphingobacterium alkalisoli TaxID=1874115 RepID=A0A4U0H8H5_9SPHI|nr:hypothetical protein [Sphingobacterium alkalisoli]TJY66742.1 hypothetical protein FAZ19_07430 [Sphingobacterium alkalisoli]GGH14484.1 hypothetical protein GCM10011418_15470 [Sphingobacterium alkalisoli]
MKKTNLSLVVVFLMLLSACSKDNDGGPDGGDNGYPSAVKGTIYYDWATEGILKVSLPEGVGSAFIPDDSKLNNFDISRDGKYKLTVVNEQTLGDYPIRFTLSDISNGSIVEEFIYRSPALSAYSKGYLSHDNSHILVLSNDQEDGITILKRNGEFVGRIHDINGEELGFNDQRLWLPGNALLIVHNNYIIRLDPPYTSGKLLKEMEYEDWGDVAVNPAGTQLAVRIANHVYTMDMDGSNLKQVTTSNFKEAVPEFSPDGKYLLVGTEYRQTGPFGWMWSLKIIPNDGKEYNVDPIAANSPGVIPVFVKGKNKIETAGGQMIWR